MPSNALIISAIGIIALVLLFGVWAPMSAERVLESSELRVTLTEVEAEATQGPGLRFRSDYTTRCVRTEERDSLGDPAVRNDNPYVVDDNGTQDDDTDDLQVDVLSATARTLPLAYVFDASVSAIPGPDVASADVVYTIVPTDEAAALFLITNQGGVEAVHSLEPDHLYSVQVHAADISGEGVITVAIDASVFFRS